ncbi:hypothetical protein C8R45DRAFT_911496 [Mycena sanguinolenta]|nr:hypothetical protein C8R45DRAFT_911496 [Mycena sanguinolenta]
MESIPPEIWTEVFSFCCTDDGSTGRALSMVSRAVHVGSKPLKYQSVCVVGLAHLLKLLATLSELPPDERKVKYLFIAGLNDGLLDMARRRLHADTGGEGIPDDEKTLDCILRLVAPGLLTLHIHHTSTRRQSLFLTMELPLLTELTLHGPFKSSHPHVLRPRTQFPSLKKLQIYHFSFRPADFLYEIAHTAPLLTHLRVPQRSFTPYDIQVALRMLQPTGSDPDQVQFYLPNSLVELVIEVEPFPGSLDSAESNDRANQFLKKFGKIAGESNGRVRLVDGRSDWMPAGQAKEEWLANAQWLEN